MVVGTSSTGLIKEEMRAGINFSISLLETRAQRLVSEARAAFFTSDLVSMEEDNKANQSTIRDDKKSTGKRKEKNSPQMASTMTGIMSGMARAHWSAAEVTS